VIERATDVVDGGLTALDVEGRGFEKNIGAGGLQPVVNIGGLCIILPERPIQMGWIKTIRVSDPAQTPGCDSRNAKSDSVERAERFFPVDQKLRERPVDVAEAEEAKVVDANVGFSSTTTSVVPGGLPPLPELYPITVVCSGVIL